ncbi:MAG: hypothetical protein E7117_04145 [Bacteroidales bacterium]|nr:hypothetical protein [Bacteroidales bacterium]
MKKILLIIACVLCALVVSAQEQKVKQKVHLKDGTEIIGYVALQPDGSYVVQNESGDMFYYTAPEIKKIIEIEDVKVKTVKLKEKNETVPVVEYKGKGYMGMVGLALGISEVITMVNGYRFSPHFYLGFEAGIGYNTMAYGVGIPLNLYLMSEFSKKRVAMFASLSGGCFFSISNEVAAPQAMITLGVRTRMRKNPNLAMWYGLQGGVSQHYDDDGYTYFTYMAPEVALKLAFSF